MSALDELLAEFMDALSTEGLDEGSLEDGARKVAEMPTGSAIRTAQRFAMWTAYLESLRTTPV